MEVITGVIVGAFISIMGFIVGGLLFYFNK